MKNTKIEITISQLDCLLIEQKNLTLKTVKDLCFDKEDHKGRNSVDDVYGNVKEPNDFTVLKKYIN